MSRRDVAKVGTVGAARPVDLLLMVALIRCGLALTVTCCLSPLPFDLLRVSFVLDLFVYTLWIFLTFSSTSFVGSFVNRGRILVVSTPAKKSSEEIDLFS